MWCNIKLWQNICQFSDSDADLLLCSHTLKSPPNQYKEKSRFHKSRISLDKMKGAYFIPSPRVFQVTVLIWSSFIYGLVLKIIDVTEEAWTAAILSPANTPDSKRALTADDADLFQMKPWTDEPWWGTQEATACACIWIRMLELGEDSPVFSSNQTHLSKFGHRVIFSLREYLRPDIYNTR